MLAVDVNLIKNAYRHPARIVGCNWGLALNSKSKRGVFFFFCVCAGLDGGTFGLMAGCDVCFLGCVGDSQGVYSAAKRGLHFAVVNGLHRRSLMREMQPG